jgi:4-amino-4-deoxy-L-arabinose transferase-like glycosyltransferase
MFNTQHLSQNLDIYWLILLALYILVGVVVVPYHADESTHLYTSRDFAYLFLERDFAKIAYSPVPHSPQEQNLRLLNGSIYRYGAGLAWYIGGLTATDVNEQWDWGAEYAYNVSVGHRPSETLLFYGRWVSALMMVGGLLALFACGLLLGGRWTVYPATLFYALSPALLLNGRRAMLEGSVMLFGLLALLAGLWLVKHGFRWRDALWLGIAAGAAVAAKHSNVIPVLGIFAGVGVVAFIPPIRKSMIYHAPTIIVAGVISILTFYALNPAWWLDPLGAATEAARLRTELIEIQSSVFGDYPHWGARLTGFWQQTLVAKPMYYEVAGWEGYIGEEIARYQASWQAGVRLPAWLGLPLALTGVYALWDTSRRGMMHHAPTTITLIWALVTVGLTLLLTPIEWQRYYLPVLVVWCVLWGQGVNLVVQWIRSATHA